jgi:hypothetical protein
MVGIAAFFTVFVFAATASASNKAQVEIDHFEGPAPQVSLPGTFFGRVIAGKPKCGKGRKVTLFRREGGGKTKIGLDTSEQTMPETYRWEINGTAQDGDVFFAKMKRKGTCKKAVSEDFRYPEDNSRASADRASKAVTKVTVRGWDPAIASPAGEWSGRLTSEKAKCLKNRYIELFLRGGKDAIGQGNTTAEKEGKKWIWRVPTFAGPPEDGEYFVTVTPTADCSRDESKTFVYPDDDPPPRGI